MKVSRVTRLMFSMPFSHWQLALALLWIWLFPLDVGPAIRPSWQHAIGSGDWIRGVTK